MKKIFFVLLTMVIVSCNSELDKLRELPIDELMSYIEENPDSELLSAIKGLIDDKRKAIDKSEYGRVRDKRDGKLYNTILMRDENIWMAENMRFDGINRACRNNNDSFCEKYGYLYTYEDAIKACPDGWHLPSNDEWDRLFRLYGGIFDPSKWTSGDTEKTFDYLKTGGITKFNLSLGGDGRVSYNGKYKFGWTTVEEEVGGSYWSSTIIKKKVYTYLFGSNNTLTEHQGVMKSRALFKNQKQRDLAYCRCIETK